MPEEQETAVAEQGTTEELENVLEEGEASSKSAEVEPESKKGGETDSKPEDEEDIEQKVTRLAQSIAGKTTATLEKQRNELTKRITVLEAELSDKAWDVHLGTLFNEDEGKLGEDEAKKRQKAREEVSKVVKEYKGKSAQVERILAKLGDASENDIDEFLLNLKNPETGKVPNLTQAVNILGANLRDWKAREEVWNLIFPEDKEKVAKVGAYIKKFEKAKDLDDYELIMEGIKETMRSRREPFVPDSTKSGGGGELTDKKIMENYQKDPKNPDNAKAYSELRVRKGLTS